LPREFYARDAAAAAPALLGARLVRQTARGRRISGVIIETEAYGGPDDSASHARRGKTPRTVSLFGAPGRAYVYLVYGMHIMLNVVVGVPGGAEAVLIRGVALESAAADRGRRGALCDGPGKVTRALAIDRTHDGIDLTAGRELWIAPGTAPAPEAIRSSARRGIPYALPHDRDAPLRWRIDTRCIG
jgi:DNA-3-methyladenine glycosylase